jgi:hypothetical protein
MSAADEILDLAGACSLLKMGPKAVRELARLKKIPSLKVDRRGTLRFSRTALILTVGGRSDERKAASHGR